MPIKLILDYLKSLHPIPAGLSEMLGVPAILRDQTLRRNECLITQGARSARAYFVKSGLLKASMPQANGDEQILLFWEPHEIVVLEAPFFRNEPSAWQVTALETTKLAGITRSDMDGVYKRLPEMQNHTDIILRQQVEKRDKLIRILRSPKGRRYALFQQLFPTLWMHLDNRTVRLFLDISDKTLTRSKRQ